MGNRNPGRATFTSVDQKHMTPKSTKVQCSRKASWTPADNDAIKDTLA